MFLIWIWQLIGLLTSVNKQMKSQITTCLDWLFTLYAYVRPLSTVGEYMVLQNSISINYFWYSVQGWGFSPVCISKCLPKVPALLNDFLHSVVQLCGFPHCRWRCAPSIFQFVWMTFCTVHKCGDSPQCEWAYECSDFQLDWITFCILCTCVVSLHYGWACVGLCDCGIVALVAFVRILSSHWSPVCFDVMSHEWLFR